MRDGNLAVGSDMPLIAQVDLTDLPNLGRCSLSS